MDIECRLCSFDFLFFDSEFVRLKCNHLFHQECIEEEKDTCPICKKEQEKNSRQVAVCRRDAEKGETLEASDVGEMRPVTWDEMDRVQTECSRLLDIFAEYIANVADADRSPQPLTYLDEVTKACTRIAYPTLLIKKVQEGLKKFKTETEALYRKDENDDLINFGIPVRYNEETTTKIYAVRRCLEELNKWIEEAVTRTDQLKKWEKDLLDLFPNITNFDVILRATKDKSSELQPTNESE